jgi:hypothetical protein
MELKGPVSMHHAMKVNRRNEGKASCILKYDNGKSDSHWHPLDIKLGMSDSVWM